MADQTEKTPADPFGHREGCVFGDTESDGGGHVVADRHEVPADVGIRAECRGEPGAGGAGVEERLGSGEALRGDDEQRFGRVGAVEDGPDLGVVHVGGEGQFEPCRQRRREGLGEQARAEIGATDAQMHDVADRLLRGAEEFAGMHARHEGIETLAGCGNFGAGCGRRGVEHAGGAVQCGAVFGEIDRIAGKHGGDAILQPGLVGQGEQRFHCRRGDALLGVIEQQAVGGAGEVLEARRIGREERAHAGLADGVAVALQGVGGAACVEPEVVVVSHVCRV